MLKKRQWPFEKKQMTKSKAQTVIKRMENNCNACFPS